MPNIYLKVTIEKTWRSQNFDFRCLKMLSPGQCLGSSNSRRYHWSFKLLVAILKSEVWGQNFVWLFYYFNFEKNYEVLKSKSPCILLNKNINFNKNETEWKMKNPTHSFRKNNLVLQCKQSYKLKVKLWCVGARERKKGAFLYRLFCPKGIF